MDIKLHGLKNLTNRIPGLMTRSLPGKLWIRIGRELASKGFSAADLGQCLYRAYREYSPGIRNIAVIEVVDVPAIVERLNSISVAAARISSTNTRKKMELRQDLYCDEPDCEDCDDKNSCDTLRVVVATRGKYGN